MIRFELTIFLILISSAFAKGQNCIYSSSLIPQDTIELCCNNPVVLSPNQEYSMYHWSNGETTKDIIVDYQGVYFLEALPTGAADWICDSVVVDGCVPSIDTICWSALPLSPQELGLSTLIINGFPISVLPNDMFSTDEPLIATYTYDCSCHCSVADDTIYIIRTGNNIIDLLPGPLLDTSSLRICENLEEHILLITDVPGGVFTSDNLAIVTLNDTFYIDPKGSSSGDLVYHVSIGGCLVEKKWALSIVPPEDVVFQNLPPNPICTNSPPIQLSALPLGGEFFLDEEFLGNTLIPSNITEQTTMDLAYRAQDKYGCAVESIVSVEFRPPPIVSMIHLDQRYCTNDPALPMVGVPSGGQFLIEPPGPIGPNNILNLGSISPGHKVIRYTYSDSYCTNSVTREFDLYNPPYVRILNTDSVFCSSDSPIMLSVNRTDGNFFPNDYSNGVIRPQELTIGSYAVRYTVIDNNGCQNSDEFRFAVEPLPTIRIDNIYTCQPNTLTLLNFTSSINPFNSDWRVNSGQWFTQNSSSFSYNFGVPGQHSVNLQAYDIHGCRSDTLFIVDVPEYNNSQIHLLDSIALVGEEIEFSIEPTTPLTSYLWIFGDGGISSDSIATHAYALSGVYDIVLSSYDVFGCPDTSFSRVLIKDFLDIDFDIVNLYPNPTSGEITVKYYLPIPATVQVVVFDEAGKYVQEQVLNQGAVIQPGTEQFEMSLSGLNPGVYVLAFYLNTELSNGLYSFRHGSLAAERLKPINQLKFIKH